MGTWLKRMGILAVLGFPLAVIGTRLNLFDFRIGFSIIQITMLLALSVFLLSIVTWWWQRSRNPASAKAAGIAAILALLPIIGLGSQLVSARSLPMIHNISTDTVNPPQFDQIVSLRGDTANSLTYDSEVLAAVQQAAYPEVKTLVTDMGVQAAFRRSVELAQRLGWKIVATNQETGLIEATDTTTLWQFKDDIVIRIEANDVGGTEIDLRSVSRVGKSDLGANAKRITAFIDAFEE